MGDRSELLWLSDLLERFLVVSLTDSLSGDILAGDPLAGDPLAGDLFLSPCCKGLGIDDLDEPLDADLDLLRFLLSLGFLDSMDDDEDDEPLPLEDDEDPDDDDDDERALLFFFFSFLSLVDVSFLVFLSCIFLCSLRSFSSSPCRFYSSLSLEPLEELLELERDFRLRVERLKSPSKAGFY